MTNKTIDTLKINNENTLFKSFKQAMNDKDVKKIRHISKFVDEQDLAEWIYGFEPTNQIFFLRSLDRITAAEVFNQLDSLTISTIINGFSQAETKELLQPLFTDDIIDIIEEAPSSLVLQILNSISVEQRKSVNTLLGYPEDSIGSEMDVDFIKFNLNDNVSIAFKKIKKSSHKAKVDKGTNCYYVTDDRNILVGFFYLEDLISADLNEKISSIMKTDVVFARALHTKEKGLQKAHKYQVAELPVVDNGLRLVGVLSADTLLEISEEEFEENFSKAAGITETSSNLGYFNTDVRAHFSSRIFWLTITFAVSLISNIIITLVIGKNDFGNQEWLFFILPYLPFLLAMIGNIALQATAVMIKFIATDEIHDGNYRKVFWKEAKILGLILIFIFTGIFIRKIIFDLTFYDKTFDNQYILENIIIFCVILFSVTIAYFFSIMLPILADYFDYDPTLMSSPLLTTLIDLFVTGTAFLITYGFFEAFA